METGRLHLRLTRPEDADALLAYYGLPEVVRYTPHEVWTPVAAAEHAATRAQRTGLDGPTGAISWVVEERGTVVGDVALWSTSTPRGVGELGFALNPAYAGRGVATEAVRAVIEHGVRTSGLHRVEARVDPRNVRSGLLCLRAGLKLEGVLRMDYWCKGEWTDTAVYSCCAPDL